MKRLAVYAGSFDPPTNGHIDIIRRVQPLFDKLHLVIAENPRKAPFFTSQERRSLLEEALAPLLPKESFEVHVHDPDPKKRAPVRPTIWRSAAKPSPIL